MNGWLATVAGDDSAVIYARALAASLDCHFLDGDVFTAADTILLVIRSGANPVSIRRWRLAGRTVIACIQDTSRLWEINGLVDYAVCYADWMAVQAKQYILNVSVVKFDYFNWPGTGSSLCASHASIKIGWHGQITADSRLVELMTAVTALRQRGMDVGLLAPGQVADADVWKQLLSLRKQNQLHGLVAFAPFWNDRNDIMATLADCQAICLPATTTHSAVAAAVHSLGKPLILSYVPGHMPFIDSALFCEPSPESIQSALRYLLGSATVYDDYAARTKAIGVDDLLAAIHEFRGRRSLPYQIYY